MGDLHIRGYPPIHRVDNYYKTQFNKLNRCLRTGYKNGVAHVLLPGDVFNNYGRDSYKVVYDFADVVTKYNQNIYAVMGQHDIRYHRTDLTETPFHILCKSGVLTLLGENPHVLEKRLHLYGASWDDIIPKVQDKKAYNVLVIHKMVIKDKKLWPGQEDYVTGKYFLRNYKDFNLIVCGDNHSSFSCTLHDRMLVNCGSLLRMRSDQKNHQPCFYIHDTEKLKHTKYRIKIEKYENVFNLNRIEEATEKRQKKKKGKFVTSLKTKIDKVSFDNRIKRRLASPKLPDRVKYYIEKAYFMEAKK